MTKEFQEGDSEILLQSIIPVWLKDNAIYTIKNNPGDE